MFSFFSYLGRMKIASKLVLLLIVFGFIPAAVGLVISELSKDKFHEAIRKPLQQLSVSIGDTIDRNLYER